MMECLELMTFCYVIWNVHVNRNPSKLFGCCQNLSIINGKVRLKPHELHTQHLLTIIFVINYLQVIY